MKLNIVVIKIISIWKAVRNIILKSLSLHRCVAQKREIIFIKLFLYFVKLSKSQLCSFWLKRGKKISLNYNVRNILLKHWLAEPQYILWKHLIVLLKSHRVILITKTPNYLFFSSPFSLIFFLLFSFLQFPCKLILLKKKKKKLQSTKVHAMKF